MSDYVKSTNFASKDALATGNPLKIVKGTEIDTEFNNIATSIATKAPLNSPTFIGTPAAPTASAGTSTTQLATTAFVQQEIGSHTVSTAQIEDNAVTNAKLAVGAAVANIGFTPADSTATVNLTGDQTVAGTKTFTAGVRFNDGTTQTTAAASPNTTNVLNATAGASVGAVGTYASLRSANTTAVSPGGTKAGADLRYSESGQAGTNGVSGTAPSGTWRCMGRDISTTDEFGNPFYTTTLWLRIS